jgi:hypothetical protein
MKGRKTMEDPKKSFFDEDPKEEGASAPNESPEGEESQVRIPHTEGDPLPPRNNGENLATISLILALASIFCCGIPASIAAIVTAILSRRALGRFTGSALAGLIIGIVSVLLTVAMTVLLSVIMAILEEIIAEAGGELLFLPLWR